MPKAFMLPLSGNSISSTGTMASGTNINIAMTGKMMHLYQKNRHCA